MRTGIIGLFAMALCAACSAAPAPVAAVADAPATLARSSQYTMTSSQTGQTFVIQVAEPIDPLPPGEKAPVIYVLDGNWYFGMATDTARLHAIGGGMGPAYVVAISYPDPTFKAVVARRETDLLHNTRPGAEGTIGGGGAAFLSFLTDEVRPFVEKRFPIDSGQSVLAGQSLGGLFAANVLMKHPDAFSAYLIGSPSIWADASVLPAARDFKGGAGQRVFIGVGGGESPLMRQGAASLAEALSAPATGLRVEQMELAKHSHSSMQGAWFASGLYYVLPKAAAN